MFITPPPPHDRRPCVEPLERRALLSASGEFDTFAMESDEAMLAAESDASLVEVAEEVAEAVEAFGDYVDTGGRDTEDADPYLNDIASALQVAFSDLQVDGIDQTDLNLLGSISAIGSDFADSYAIFAPDDPNPPGGNEPDPGEDPDDVGPDPDVGDGSSHGIEDHNGNGYVDRFDDAMDLLDHAGDMLLEGDLGTAWWLLGRAYERLNEYYGGNDGPLFPPEPGDGPRLA